MRVASFITILAAGFIIAIGINAPSLSQNLAKAVYVPDTAIENAASQEILDRLLRDKDQGKISLKESVMLRARLFFAPERIPSDSPYALSVGQPRPGEEMTGFFKDVHRVKELLSEDEKKELHAYSPDLAVIISSWNVRK